MEFHYGSPHDVLPYQGFWSLAGALGFVERLAHLCTAAGHNHTRAGPSRALDLGCAVGGASFQLQHHFREVVGIDYSHAFVAAAQKMKENGRCNYTARITADLMEDRVAVVPPGGDRTAVQFEQGDACNLRENLGEFDAVLGANLLCRLPKPRALLRRLRTLVRPGGVVVFVSPYSWLEEYTPKEEWLGGYEEEGSKMLSALEEGTRLRIDGRRCQIVKKHQHGFEVQFDQDCDYSDTKKVPVFDKQVVDLEGGEVQFSVLVDSFETLKKEMESDGAFTLLKEDASGRSLDENVPFLIREHERKFALGVSHATVWRRN